MAVAFNQAKGKAQKSTHEQFEFKNGDNKVRLVGDILPRYVYWIAGTNGKNIPVESLAFNRETETFDNNEGDPVRDKYPDLKCGWAYAMMGIDPSDGKVKVVNLKKKLFEQIMTTAEDLGDPTDPETGWAVCFKRVKTGAMAYNVEYQLQPLKCKSEPLTDAERAAVAEAPTIDEVMPRPTKEGQIKFLDSLEKRKLAEEGPEDEALEEEFDVD